MNPVEVFVKIIESSWPLICGLSLLANAIIISAIMASSGTSRKPNE